jgi:hypothetical protein
MAVRTYRLVVEGELSDRMSPVFEGMSLARGNGQTTLTGPIRDQSELQGLLQRVSDLGLTLVEVTQDTRKSESVSC